MTGDLFGDQWQKRDERIRAEMRRVFVELDAVREPGDCPPDVDGRERFIEAFVQSSRPRRA